MSHFTVIVIGNAVKEQLQPFHEFECTGSNDQFVQDVDVTEEMLASIAEGESIEEALSYHGIEDKIVDDESKVEKVGDECLHKYGYAIVKDGKLVKAVNRTNPNKKWDWWVIGGRWSGYFRLRPGAAGMAGTKSWTNRGKPSKPGYCDSARIGDIDFDGMRAEAGESAGKEWDLFHKHVGDCVQGFRKWDEVYKTEDSEATRLEYHAQPLRKRIEELRSDMSLLSEDREFFFWCRAEEYLCDRDTFVQQARDRAIAPYAVVHEGRWLAKGEMGWFGFSDDKCTQEDWNRKVNELIDSLPADTWLTLVDCHI